MPVSPEEVFLVRFPDCRSSGGGEVEDVTVTVDPGREERWDRGPGATRRGLDARRMRVYNLEACGALGADNSQVGRSG